MSSKTLSVSITILGKEYKIACDPEEQDNLIRSAGELDAQMRKMRDSGKVSGAERIAVMAALNLSHELQTLRNHPPVITANLKECLDKMKAKIENVLEKR